MSLISGEILLKCYFSSSSVNFLNFQPEQNRAEEKEEYLQPPKKQKKNDKVNKILILMDIRNCYLQNQWATKSNRALSFFVPHSFTLSLLFAHIAWSSIDRVHLVECYEPHHYECRF